MTRFTTLAVAAVGLCLTSCGTQEATGPGTHQPVHLAAVSGVELSAGILYEYFPATSDTTGRTPSFFGCMDTVRAVRLPFFYPDTTCTVVYSGYISVPADSSYSLRLNAPGAARLSVHGQLIDSGETVLLQQGAHPLRIVAAFADRLPPSVRLLYAAGDGPESAVDRSMLSHATLPNPDDYVVRVYAPDSAARFAQGDTIHVRWATNPDTFSSAVLDISVDEGETWYAMVNHAIPSFDTAWGNFGWVVPDSLRQSLQPAAVSSVSNTCRISAHNYGQTHFGYSSLFSIVQRL